MKLMNYGINTLKTYLNYLGSHIMTSIKIRLLIGFIKIINSIPNINLISNLDIGYFLFI